MEPAIKGQRRTGNSFESICPRLLIAWLRSPKGQPLREAIEEALLPNMAERLFDGSVESKKLQAEVIERADKTTRAVVTMQPLENGSVEVKVYGPRELRVKIIPLPMVPQTVECELAVEKLVEIEAGKSYRNLLWPTDKRAHAILGRMYFNFWEWVAKERDHAARVLVSETLSELKNERKDKTK